MTRKAVDIPRVKALLRELRRDWDKPPCAFVNWRIDADVDADAELAPYRTKWFRRGMRTAIDRVRQLLKEMEG